MYEAHPERINVFSGNCHMEQKSEGSVLQSTMAGTTGFVSRLGRLVAGARLRVWKPAKSDAPFCTRQYRDGLQVQPMTQKQFTTNFYRRLEIHLSFLAELRSLRVI